MHLNHPETIPTSHTPGPWKNCPWSRKGWGPCYKGPKAEFSGILGEVTPQMKTLGSLG